MWNEKIKRLRMFSFFVDANYAEEYRGRVIERLSRMVEAAWVLQPVALRMPTIFLVVLRLTTVLPRVITGRKTNATTRVRQYSATL